MAELTFTPVDEPLTFTPVEEPVTPGREGLLSAPWNRLRRGGQRVANAIYPAAPRAPRGHGEAALDYLKEAGSGLLEQASAITAPLGVAARPVGEFIGKNAAWSDETRSRQLAHFQQMLQRAVDRGDEAAMRDLETHIANLESGTPESRIAASGEAAAQGAEMLGGLFTPGAGITPSLGELAPVLNRPVRSLLRGAPRAGVPNPVPVAGVPSPRPSFLGPEPVPTGPGAEINPVAHMPEVRDPVPPAVNMTERAAARQAPARPDLGMEPTIGTAAERPVGEVYGPPNKPTILDEFGKPMQRELTFTPVAEEALPSTAVDTPLRTAGEVSEQLTGGRINPRVPVPRARPADVTSTLDAAENLVTGGLRDTQRQSNVSTLSAAEDAATGRSLDLGEVGRRRAATRGLQEPQPITAAEAVVPEAPAAAPWQRLPNAEEVVAEVPKPKGRKAPKFKLQNPATPDEGGALPSRGDIAARRLRRVEETPAAPPAPPTPPAAPPASTPSVPPAARPAMGFLARMRKRFTDALPQESFVIRDRPNSPVITDLEHHQVNIAKQMDALVKEPWWKALKEMDPNEIKRLESEAVRSFEAGGKTPEAFATATEGWPQGMKDYIAYRTNALEAEQLARERLGMARYPEEAGPYIPRMTDPEFANAQNLPHGFGNNALQTGIKSAGYERDFPTQLLGEAEGMTYVDPRNAILTRELNGIKARTTEQLITSLRGRGLFETPEAAKAVSPTGEAFAISGIPGAKRYWAPTASEAKFLVQNLKSQPSGYRIPVVGGQAKQYTDQMFRNPNLVNPAPHVTKNMWAKYILASGDVNPAHVVRDGIELFKHPELDTVQKFREFMPYLDNDPAYVTFQNELIKGPVEGGVRKGLNLLGMINKPSSKVIFKWGDPTMRYSLFKKYLAKGMEPQEAANNAWIDLVRYGTRSDLTDFWKNWPANFFVPWRTGAVASVLKQGINHPVRTGLVIGGVDAIREARYRETGRWTHLPWDYVEGPIVTALEAGLQGDIRNLTYEAISNALFGPAGEATAGNIRRMVDKPSAQQIGKTLWGLAQIMPSGEIVKEFNEFTKDGDPSHLVNSVLAALVAERDTKGVKPHRLLEAIPESVLPKSRKVIGRELTNPINKK